MGMLVPPAIFMIVIAQVTNTLGGWQLFVAGFIPAVVIMLCLMAVVLHPRAARTTGPVDYSRPSLKRLGPRSGATPPSPMVVPFVIPRSGLHLLGQSSTATEAGRGGSQGLRLPRRQVSTIAMSPGARWAKIAYDSAILTAAGGCSCLAVSLGLSIT